MTKSNIRKFLYSRGNDLKTIDEFIDKLYLQLPSGIKRKHVNQNEIILFAWDLFNDPVGAVVDGWDGLTGDK